MTFGRKKGIPLEEQDVHGTAYEACADKMIRASRRFSSRATSKITVKGRDGVALVGRYLAGTNGKAVLFAHGYCSTPMNNFSLQAERLAEQGYALLLPDERAHGESGGRYTELGLEEQYDLLAWLEWLSGQEGIVSIAVYGMSMGCAAAAYASDKIANPKVKALVLDSGFISPYDEMASDCRKRHLPPAILLPWVVLCGKVFLKKDIRIPVTDSLKNTKLPALFIHGSADSNVSPEQGLRNFEACASAKDRLLIEGADHTLAYAVGGEKTAERLDRFLRENL